LHRTAFGAVQVSIRHGMCWFNRYAVSGCFALTKYRDCRGTERPATTRRRSVVESRHDRHPRPTAIVPPRQSRGRGGVNHDSTCLAMVFNHPPQVGAYKKKIPAKSGNLCIFREAESVFPTLHLPRNRHLWQLAEINCNRWQVLLYNKVRNRHLWQLKSPFLTR